MDKLVKRFFMWKGWPFWFFEVPYFPIFLYLSAKARSLVFFSALNPRMYMGGFVHNSKYADISGLKPEYIPKTLYLDKFSTMEEVSAQLTALGLDYPLIAKPDRGERGWMVAKVDDAAALENYLQNYPEEIIIQEYIDYPVEMSILYYRFPDEQTGHINSVARKEFEFITGDGQSSVGELMQQKFEGVQLEKLLKEVPKEVYDNVLEKGKRKQLNFIGNLVRGALCYNANDLISNQLIQVFDTITADFEGFYYGRFDLRVSSIEDLLAGRNIKILEINGANCMPLHVMDDRIGFRETFRVNVNHWKTMYAISVINHKRGIPYMPLKEAWAHSWARVIRKRS